MAADTAIRGGSRRELVVLAGAGGALLVSIPLVLWVRIPETADLALVLAVNGPRLLLAAAVGIGLAVSATITGAAASSSHSGTGREMGMRREMLTLAVSFGAAAGGFSALDWGLLGLVPDFAIGALLGAALYAAVLHLLSRVRYVTNLLVGLGMGVIAVGAVLTLVGAKGNPDGFRHVLWWMMGDLSRATWWSAAPVLLTILVLATAAVQAARSGASRRLGVLAALLWGIAIGAGGIIAWFGLLIALAAKRVAGAASLRHAISLSAALGALAMIWADAIPRLLIGGYSFPINLAVAMVAIPWYLNWGPRLGRPETGRAATALRIGDFATAGLTALGVAAFVGLLTFVVSLVG